MFDYIVDESFIPYFINADPSGLDDHDILAAERFTDSVLCDADDAGLQFMHWLYDTPKELEDTLKFCAITRKYTLNPMLLRAMLKED